VLYKIVYEHDTFYLSTYKFVNKYHLYNKYQLLYLKVVDLLHLKVSYGLLHLKVVFKLCFIQIRKKVICSVAILKWQKIPELQQGLKLFIKLNKYPGFRCSTLLLKIIIYTNFNYCC